jgi:DNA-directed RNA polymerase subunit K/omega
MNVIIDMRRTPPPIPAMAEIAEVKIVNSDNRSIFIE